MQSPNLKLSLTHSLTGVGARRCEDLLEDLRPSVSMYMVVSGGVWCMSGGVLSTLTRPGQTRTKCQNVASSRSPQRSRIRISLWWTTTSVDSRLSCTCRWAARLVRHAKYQETIFSWSYFCSPDLGGGWRLGRAVSPNRQVNPLWQCPQSKVMQIQY